MKERSGKNENLEEMLLAYACSGAYPFHMPGHKRQPLPGADGGPLGDIIRIDITEIPGFDDLHDPKGILLAEMRRAAALYGVQDTLFSVNGSTASNLAAVFSCTEPGDSILVPSNCHRSVYHAASLRGLKVILLPVEGDPQSGSVEESNHIQSERLDPDCPEGVNSFCPEKTDHVSRIDTDAETCGSLYETLRDRGPVRPEGVEAAFRDHPDIRCVVVTSPTYDGVVSDIARIAEITRAHEAFLIVDEAHGAHLPFLHEAYSCFEDNTKLSFTALQAEGIDAELPATALQAEGIDAKLPATALQAAQGVPGDHAIPEIPCSAITEGADLVIHSLHKTLPAMTQTSILHNVSGRVPTEKLRYWMDHFVSSSPSYVLMASITRCLHFLEGEMGRLRSADGRMETGFREGCCKEGASEKGCIGKQEDSAKQDGNAFTAYLRRLARFRQEASAWRNLQLLTPHGHFDPTKLLLGVGTSGLTGEMLAGILRETYNIETEFAMPSYVLAISGICDAEEGFTRLARALREIDTDTCAR